MRKEHKQYVLILGLIGILYIVWPSEMIGKNSAGGASEVAEINPVARDTRERDAATNATEPGAIPTSLDSANTEKQSPDELVFDRPREFAMEEIVRHNPFATGDALIAGMLTTDPRTGTNAPTRVSAVYESTGVHRGERRVTALVNQNMIHIGEKLGRRKRVVAISDSGVAILNGG